MGSHFPKMLHHLHHTYRIPIIHFSHSTVVSNLTGLSTISKTLKHQSGILAKGSTYGSRQLYKQAIMLVMFPGEMWTKCILPSMKFRQGPFPGIPLSSSTESKQHLRHHNGCKSHTNYVTVT